LNLPGQWQVVEFDVRALPAEFIEATKIVSRAEAGEGEDPGGRRSIAGWPSGTSIDSQDTLAFSALAGVRPMTEVFPLARAAEAYERMMSGKARFRVVLTPRA